MDEEELVQPEDAEIADAWEEEESPETEEEALLEGTDEPAPEAQKPEEPAQTSADDTFVLKHMDEVKSATKAEVVELAQKGMDYDRIRTERDELRGYRTENDPLVALVTEFAERCGMTPTDYVDFCRKQELLAQGIGEETAAAQVSLERREAAIAAQEAQQRAVQDASAAAQRQQEDAAAARRTDMNRFLSAYPAVKAEEIPSEVWAMVSKGESLVSAYTMNKNQRLEADLAAERQNKKNAVHSIGSLGSSGGGEKDPLDAWWSGDD